MHSPYPKKCHVYDTWQPCMDMDYSDDICHPMHNHYPMRSHVYDTWQTCMGIDCKTMTHGKTG